MDLILYLSGVRTLYAKGIFREKQKIWKPMNMTKVVRGQEASLESSNAIGATGGAILLGAPMPQKHANKNR